MPKITHEMMHAGQLAVREEFPIGGSASACAQRVYEAMHKARPPRAVSRMDLLKFVHDVGLTAACSNSDHDVMGRALDDIVAQAQRILRRAQR